MIWATILIGMVLIAAVVVQWLNQRHQRLMAPILAQTYGIVGEEEEELEEHSLSEQCAEMDVWARAMLELVNGHRVLMNQAGYSGDLADQMALTLYERLLHG